ncbi:tyrosine-type recombinase/integrase [Streptococcus sp. DD10]|uniref:tyrosine-type recombinase/integrase n=1 Tax=Streptococcus sp. DD10 TaxID=1777878 RepID=UPI003FA7D0B8
MNKHFTSHSICHTLISQSTDCNVPLKAIMKRVGHSDSKTTLQIYTHVTQTMESNVVSLLNKITR